MHRLGIRHAAHVVDRGVSWTSAALRSIRVFPAEYDGRGNHHACHNQRATVLRNCDDATGMVGMRV